MTKMYSFIEEKEITSVNTISLEVGLTLNQLFILFFTTIHPFIYILIQSIYVTPCSIMLKILANSIILPLSICFNHTDQYYVFDPYEFVMAFSLGLDLVCIPLFFILSYALEYYKYFNLRSIRIFNFNNQTQTVT